MYYVEYVDVHHIPKIETDLLWITVTIALHCSPSIDRKNVWSVIAVIVDTEAWSAYNAEARAAARTIIY
jgi:hypothetical protein